MATPPPPRQRRVLRMPDVSSKTGLSQTRIDWLEKRGLFPRRIPLAARSVGWLEHEVDAWIEDRIAARDDAGREAEARQLRDPNRWLKEAGDAA